MQLNGKRVAVTGGSGGLGQVLCASLKQAGALVTVVDRVAPPAVYGYVEADLSTTYGITSAAQKIAALDLDCLINLAGVQFFGTLQEQSENHILLNYMVNLVAPVMLARAILPGMYTKNSGTIVNVGSTFGSIAFAHFATYSSSKAGLKGFSEALRREVAHTNIHITYVAPRAVKTPLNGPRVLQLAKETGMNMDAPELVAHKILGAIKADKNDVYIGFPESFFARVNAVVPRLVDRALAKNDAVARRILAAPQN
jgi:short-subunit dehydrogenase